MPETQPDINFQPKQQAYAFSSKETESKQKSENQKKHLRTIFTVIFGIFLIFFFFSLVFITLNYFRIISLSQITPAMKILPQTASTLPTYNASNKTWTIKGTLYQYDNEKIKIKISLFKIMDFIYDLNSYMEIKTSMKDGANPQVGTLYDLDQKQNLSKNVEVEYYIQNKTNIISKLTLYNNK